MWPKPAITRFASVVRNGVVRFEYKPSDGDFVQRKFTIRPTTFWQRLVSKNAQMSGNTTTPSADWYGKQVNAGSGDSAGSGSGGGGPGQGGGGGLPGGGGVINNTQAAQQSLTYLQSQRHQRRAGVFNPSNGQLLVRAPLADLDLIEQAIEILNTSPEQLYIEAKFAEIEFNDGESLGLIGTLVNPHCWVIRSSAVLVRILPLLVSPQTTIPVAIFHIRARCRVISLYRANTALCRARMKAD